MKIRNAQSPAIVRIAPSPTGYIHLGNLRTALFNWLYSRSSPAGQFILRFDDTDTLRSHQAYADATIEDFKWLGLEPDKIFYQSGRFARYDEIADQLRHEGLLYPCFETTEELEYKRKLLRAQGRAPIYDRSALSLAPAEIEAKLRDGENPHWRFKLQRRRVGWQDHVRGEQTIDTASLSDPILIREDGNYLYTLPSIVDDGDFGITDVIRGEDHVSNTGVQIEIFQALGYDVPRFGHHNLLIASSGKGLSKRDGSMSIRQLRREGFEPGAVASIAALVGTSLPLAAFRSISELAETFDLSRTSRSASKFDISEIVQLNRNLLQSMTYADLEDETPIVKAHIAEGIWEAVKGNLSFRHEFDTWKRIVAGPIKPEIASGDEEFIKSAADQLPLGVLDERSWGEWTASLKAATGRKGKALFLPLRRALTGLDHGPEMKLLLPLIGRSQAMDRLS